MDITGGAAPIVICADDFGMHPGIDEAVLALAQMHRLAATTCLVEGSSFVHSAKALSVSGLQVGLHLNFTEPLGPDAAGWHLPLPVLIARSYARRLDPVAVHRQVVRQLDRFEQVFGRAPDFVDGHQHVHQLPQIRQSLVAELVRRYPRRRLWIRNTHPGRLKRTGAFRFKASVIARLGASRLVRAAHRAGFAVNQEFLGVYNFRGGSERYARLLRMWLGAARPATVLMCHPALRSAGDSVGEQRTAEYSVLAGESAGAWLEEYGLAVCGLSVDAVP